MSFVGNCMSPFQRPYEGPLWVIEPGSKTFKLDIGGKMEAIMVDKLNPTQLDLNCPVEVTEPRPRGRQPPKQGTMQ